MRPMRELIWILRSFRRDAAFVATYIGVFALGLGTATAMVAGVRSVYGDRLPASGSSRLVRIYTGNSDAPPGSPERYSRSSMPEIREYASDSDAFQAVIANNNFSATLGIDDRGLAATGSLVSGNYFAELGQHAEVGRLIGPADDEARGRSNVVVLSDGFWRSAFGGAPHAVGSVLRINGYPFTVIGVAASGFRGTAFDYTPQFWVPITLQSEAYGSPWVVDYPDARMFDVFAVVKPGIDVARADAALLAVKRGLRVRGYTWYDRRIATAQPATTTLGAFDRLRPEVDRVMQLLVAVAVLLVLVVGANLGNALLARRMARDRQIAIQMALGATRGRLVRQHIVEGFVLGAPAIAAGILLAWGVCQAVDALSFMHFTTVRLSPPLALGAAAAGLAGAASMGLLVEWRRRETLGVLSHGRSDGAGRAGVRLRFGLMVGQVAVAFVVVLMAALLGRSARSLHSSDPGYDVTGLVEGRIYLWNRAGFDAGSMAQYDEFMRRLRLDPAVVKATSSYGQLLSGYEPRAAFQIPGRTGLPGGDSTIAFATVGLRYFSALGIPIVAGRSFDVGDTTGAPATVIVNRALAGHLWPGQSPLGRVIVRDGRRFEVVGVVGDAAEQDLNEPHVPRAYFALGDEGFAPPQQTLIVRVRGEPAAGATTLERAIQRIAPGPATVELRTVRSIRDERLAPLLALGRLVGSVAIVETVLAALGLAGLMTFLVGQRLREVSIRMALGAQRQSIFWLLWQDAARAVLFGLGAGAVLWAGTARITSSLLSGGIAAVDLPSAGIALAFVASATLGLAALPCLAGARWAPILPGE